MSPRLELVIFILVAVPAAYAVLCLFFRASNAHKTRSWVKENYPDQWNDLHAMARRHAWAGIEVLIRNGILTGAAIDEFRRRDEQLEKHAWLGILLSALLGLLVAVFAGLT